MSAAIVALLAGLLGLAWSLARRLVESVRGTDPDPRAGHDCYCLRVPAAEAVVCERATARGGEVQAKCALCECHVAIDRDSLERAAARSGILAITCLPCAPDVIAGLRADTQTQVIDLRGMESQNPPV